jgi:MFS family permease
VTTNLTLFLIVNCLEGLAIAFSYPAKQALLIQASPRRWIGTVTGLESTAMQAAGLLGSLTAPILYGWISGYILAVAGAINMIGLAVAAPILHREWKRLQRAGHMPRQAELERIGDESRPAAASQPPHGME